jgi:hypothetical protein
MASPSPQQPTVLLWRCVIIDDDVPVHAADDAAALADLLAHTMDKDPYVPVDAFTKVYRETVVRRSTLGGARQTHLYTECIELWRSWEHPEDVCDGFGKKHTRSDGMVVYWSYHTWSERERQVDSMRFKIQCDNVQKFKRSTSVVLPPSAPPLQVKPTSTRPNKKRRHSGTAWTDLLAHEWHILEWEKCSCGVMGAPNEMRVRWESEYDDDAPNGVHSYRNVMCNACYDSIYKCPRCKEYSLDDAGWCKTTYCDPQLW